MNIKQIFTKTKKKIKANKVSQFVLEKPILFLFGIMVVLMILIVVGNNLRNRIEAEEIVVNTKTVDIYTIGQSPRVKVLADVKKENVTRIVAQTGGVVQNLYVGAGDSVYRGQNLAYISTNYQGGNAASIQRQIAETSKKNVDETYDAQKEIIARQKELAEKVDANSDELLEISKDSINDTKAVLDLNDEIIRSLDDNLAILEEASQSADTDALILSTKSSKTQLLSANAQLRSGIRQLEYQTDGDNPPAQMSDLQKEMALKQLEIAEKALDLQKEMVRLQYNLALINESLSFPSSYSVGMVEEVHVRPGQMVGPGTLLFTISGNEGVVTATAYVSADLAKNVSKLEMTKLDLNGQIIELMPSYVSTEATKNLLYSVNFVIPEEYKNYLTDYESIMVEIPVGYADTNSVIPFIPIDSVYQNSQKDFVIVNSNGEAVVKQVVLGEVFGEYVEIEEGLSESDQVILNRNVIEGDKIEIRK